MDIERRIVSGSLSLRGVADAPRLVGYAAVFHHDSELIGGSFIERIAPGAFKDSISTGDDVRALINHNPEKILGRTVSKTLMLREDDKGLHVTIDPPNTSYAKDLLESTKRGDISQMSFGFQVPPGGDRWERGVNGRPDIRTLLKVKLFDVSPTTFPAYPDTDVAVRAHERFLGHPSHNAESHFSQDVATRRRRNQLSEIEDGYWPQPGSRGGVSGSGDLHVRRRRLVLEQLAAE